MTANRCVRPSTAADTQSILELFAEAGMHPNTGSQDLQWKYWQPRADWPAPRSFILTDGSATIAHAAVVPGTCAYAAERISMIHLIDWVARPGAVGAGVALMKRIAQQVQALLAIGGSAQTQQILPRIGFRAQNRVRGYVRTLHPLRLLRGLTLPPFRVLPRFARSVAWTLAAPSAHSAEWRARRLAGSDVERIASVLPAPVHGMAVLQRSVEQIRYMLTCPIASMALFAVEKSCLIRGYFLLASAPGQARIADCWVDSDEPADWRAMIMCAVEQAKHDPQAAELAIWANDPLLAVALTDCGFHARLELPVSVRPADAASMPPVPLRVQMLDTDAAFLHEGGNGYWA